MTEGERVKGVRSVELHKRRRRRGENFPPFLFISVISSCQLRCQGCCVDVAAPAGKPSLDELNHIVGDANAMDKAREAFQTRTPLRGRIGLPEDIAQAALMHGCCRL